MHGLSRSKSGSSLATTSPSRPIAQNRRTVSPDADGPQPAASVRTIRATSAFERGLRPRNPALGGVSRGAVEGPLDRERGLRPRNPALGGVSRGAIEAPLDSVTRLGEPAAREAGPLEAAPEIGALAHHALV